MREFVQCLPVFIMCGLYECMYVMNAQMSQMYAMYFCHVA